MKWKFWEKPKKAVNRRKRKEEEMEVPKEWVKAQPVQALQEKYEILTKTKYRKFHIPGLRTAKRIIAIFLLMANFFISQVTLTSSPQTQPIAILFLLNSFILADYIWKTRNKPEVKP